MDYKKSFLNYIMMSLKERVDPAYCALIDMMDVARELLKNN